MKVILTGTNHLADEQEVEVGIEYDGGDTWTFTWENVNVSISDLTPVMKLLKAQFFGAIKNTAP